MSVLYFCTISLYLRRSTAMRFSVPRQLILKAQEILVGFEVGIIFDHHHQPAQAPNRAANWPGSSPAASARPSWRRGRWSRRSITFSSCAAKPFTVSTRFGIRSARRCSTTSTWDQAPLIAFALGHQLVARSPSNCRPEAQPSSTNTPTTINAIFMSLILTHDARSDSSRPVQAVDEFDQSRGCTPDTARTARRDRQVRCPVLSSRTSSRISNGVTSICSVSRKLLHHRAPLRLGVHARRDQRMPAQHAERRHRIHAQLHQRRRIGQNARALLSQTK